MDGSAADIDVQRLSLLQQLQENSIPLSLLFCKNLENTATCCYGNRCRFIHDEDELVKRKGILKEIQILKSKLNNGVCRLFSSEAGCKYGNSCRYAHLSLEEYAAVAGKIERKKEKKIERANRKAAELVLKNTTKRAEKLLRLENAIHHDDQPVSDYFDRWIEEKVRESINYGQYVALFERGIAVMKRWRTRFQSRPDIWHRFVKAKTDTNSYRLVKEFCEAVPVINRVLKSIDLMEQEENAGKAPHGRKVTVLDLCSGFGFLSMFLSDMAPVERVNRIILIDYQWSRRALQEDIDQSKVLRSGAPLTAGDVMETAGEEEASATERPNNSGSKYINSDHITGDFYELWPIPLVASKQNLKVPSCLRSLQRVVIDRALREGDLMILGIHLCGVLSLRAIDLFNQNAQRVQLMALKPCCLPSMVFAKRDEIFTIGQHRFAATIVCASGRFEAQSKGQKWNGPPRNHLEGKFNLWTENLSLGINCTECTSESDVYGGSKLIWSRCVEDIKIQEFGYQNKYIWMERSIVRNALTSLSSTDSFDSKAAGPDNRWKRLPRELKQCGHECFPSSTRGCCTCLDLRPFLDGDLYPCYEDGFGWRNNQPRNAGYCPVCNPKSYDTWETKIRIQREEKKAAEILLMKENEAARSREENDKRRAAQILTRAGVCQFVYSNGDVYDGEMMNGDRNGFGKMLYSDGVVYEGYWKDGLHDGEGIKDWCDGIVYVGEWSNGRMNGRGKYKMADGTVVEGLFEDDEFAGY